MRRKCKIVTNEERLLVTWSKAYAAVLEVEDAIDINLLDPDEIAKNAERFEYIKRLLIVERRRIDKILEDIKTRT